MKTQAHILPYGVRRTANFGIRRTANGVPPAGPAGRAAATPGPSLSFNVQKLRGNTVPATSSPLK